ncbi:hypothetical protein [Paraburkholderia guartelaensis]|uniref:hypothetical protein n=1 Tax=Paraburkholderia guartelaensis TaxID=2546446 RepID=UPI002AB6ABC9|nr:hypothetical protein [Paraburkholderia guartelaensis]
MTHLPKPDIRTMPSAWRKRPLPLSMVDERRASPAGRARRARGPQRARKEVGDFTAYTDEHEAPGMANRCKTIDRFSRNAPIEFDRRNAAQKPLLMSARRTVLSLAD